MVCTPKQCLRFIRNRLLARRPFVLCLENRPDNWFEVLESLDNYYRDLGGRDLVFHIRDQTPDSFAVEICFKS